MTVSTEVYQGQFGEFTIDDRDRQGVIIYRAGLLVAALSFTIGSGLILWQGATATVLQAITPLFAVFCLGLAISLVTIHIYLAPLHRFLQVCWIIGAIASIVFALTNSEPLALLIYSHPLTLFGVGFMFVALTGIYFKEGFCFHRLETKFLTPIVPALLLGHLAGILSVSLEKILLAIWTVFFIIFVIRKVIQPIPPDIGDKSVFVYLKQGK